MGNDAIGYFFIILLVMIAAPLVFWIGSVFYAWVKWLFNDKAKLNASFSSIEEFRNPIHGKLKINYQLGTEGEVEFYILDLGYTIIKELKKEPQPIGKHQFEIDTTLIQNGSYFLQMKTVNQKITKTIT